MYGNHVIETKHPIFAVCKLDDVLSRSNICMVRFRRLHRDKVFEAAEAKDNANIWTPSTLVILDFRIPTVKKPNIMVANPIDTQALHSTSSLSVYEEWRDRVHYLAIFQALLTARAFRFFKSQLTAWAFRFFKVQQNGMDSPLWAVIDGRAIISLCRGSLRTDIICVSSIKVNP